MAEVCRMATVRGLPFNRQHGAEYGYEPSKRHCEVSPAS
jgi:hypothetical protein